MDYIILEFLVVHPSLLAGEGGGRGGVSQNHSFKSKPVLKKNGLFVYRTPRWKIL
jgi:hypothetical protein